MGDGILDVAPSVEDALSQRRGCGSDRKKGLENAKSLNFQLVGFVTQRAHFIGLECHVGTQKLRKHRPRYFFFKLEARTISLRFDNFCVLALHAPASQIHARFSTLGELELLVLD